MGVSVLIADDARQFRLALVQWLTRQGYHPAEAATAQEADDASIQVAEPAAHQAPAAETESAPADKPAPKKRRSRAKKADDSGEPTKVVGMGDHLPRFIALSLEERLAG